MYPIHNNNSLARSKHLLPFITGLIFLQLFFSCAKLPEGVESSLRQAGPNAKELKKVLKHYSRHSADSLKFQAACFLIDHMKWHRSREPMLQTDPLFSKVHQQIDHIFRTIAGGLTLKQLTSPEARKVFAWKEKVTRSLFDTAFLETRTDKSRRDPEYLSANFLIRHIDHAFHLKETYPAVARLSFEDFCNYILPYRSADYPWFANGEELHQLFGPYLNHPDARHLNEQIAWYNAYVFRMKCLYGKKCPVENTTGIYDLFFYQKHDCNGVASWCINNFRACGIPSAVDFNAAYRELTNRHMHCSVLDSNGHWHAFNPETGVPGDYDFATYSGVNIFRFTYAAQKDSPYMLKSKDEKVPALFATPCIREVTSETKPVFEVALPFTDTTSSRLAYLYVFQKNQKGLTPATWGCIREQQAHFKNVLPHILYFPVYFSKKQTVHFASPFLLIPDQNTPQGYRLITTEEFLAGSDTSTNVFLTRKYPRKPNMLKIAEEMKGGRFEGSNDKDFRHARTLYTITTTPPPHLEEHAVRPPEAYRYYRYTAPEEHPHSNISQMELIVSDTSLSNHYAPATPPAVLSPRTGIPQAGWKLMNPRWKKFPWHDGQMTTSSGNRSVLLFELQTPQKISAIRFAPLNADNGIKPNDKYELLYWDHGWQSCGINQAQYQYIQFQDIPAGKLYWLKNIDEGNEELPFILQNGQQKFIYHDIIKFPDLNKK